MSLKNHKRHLKFFKRYFLSHEHYIFVFGIPKQTMSPHHISRGTYFYVIGLNYKKADAEIRGHFSLDDTSKIALLEQAKTLGIESLVVTSTCNRTEIYGFAQHPFQLIQLLCDNTKGTVEEFQEVAYVYKGRDAISHMFRVGSGLDSQVLGDLRLLVS